MKTYYDSADRLVRRTVDNENNGVLDEVAKYVFDGGDLALQYGTTATPTHRYLWDAALDQLLADETIGGELGWALPDHQGSVRDLVNSSGTILHHVQYDSFGETDDVIGCLFGYTGQYRDPLTELQLHGARWYDPAVGRFISEDPSGLGPDSNPYRYCENCPMILVDPTGLWSYGGTGGLTQQGEQNFRNSLPASVGYSSSPLALGSTSSTYGNYGFGLADSFVTSPVAAVDYSGYSSGSSLVTSYFASSGNSSIRSMELAQAVNKTPQIVKVSGGGHSYSDYDARYEKGDVGWGEVAFNWIARRTIMPPVEHGYYVEYDDGSSMHILGGGATTGGMLGQFACIAPVAQAFRVRGPVGVGQEAAWQTVEIGTQDVTGLPIPLRAINGGIRGPKTVEPVAPNKPTPTPALKVTPENSWEFYENSAETARPLGDSWTPPSEVPTSNGSSNWLSGRYAKSKGWAVEPGGYWKAKQAGKDVFPTQRNSGMKGRDLTDAQLEFFRRGLQSGKLPSELRGQAYQAGYDRKVTSAEDILKHPGAESRLQQAIKEYNQ